VQDLEKIEEVFFYRLEDQAELSPWGRLVWERCRKELYTNKLYDPPWNNIRYTDNFRRKASGLAGNRLVHVNERLDDLCGYLRA
jgi:hypothetical protein